MSSLAQSIFQTLAFYDTLDLPLTLLEIQSYHNYNGGAASFGELENCLETEMNGKVGQSAGFFFLSGRQDLIAKRNEKYQRSLIRMRKVRKLLSPLRFFPYLRAVAVSGSLALLNSSEGSDIDLFVITKKNRIWISRVLVSLYFQVLGERRHGQKIANRFCLNHYISEERTMREDRNLYTASIYVNLLPILGRVELAKFWERNTWIRNYFREAVVEKEPAFFHEEFHWLQKFLETLLDLTIGPILNYLSGIYQKKRIRLQEHIIVSDEELSFHPGSRGQKVLAGYQEKLI